MARQVIAATVVLLAGSLPAQSIVTITSSGLGYAVPTPVESLEPVAGYRSYESLRARYLALMLEADFITGHSVGTSIQGRTIEAFRFQSAGETAEGLPRWGAFLNGTIHAREWASPECVAAIFEWLALSTDDPVRNHVVETGAIVMSPLSNPDGFLVTQAYPDRVVGGGSSGSSGRDGRMRRKNLRSTDGVLETLDDYLLGVDLNRNHAYGFETGGSAVATSINYRGSGPGSEPESQALYAAAQLLPQDQLRLAIDFHSFSQLYYVIVDDSSTRNTAVRAAYQRMANGARGSSGRTYTSSETDLATEAVGAVDEYFTGEYGAMGYTCEIRPVFGTNGFILPADQITATRAEILAATRAGLLYASGPPALISIRRARDGAVLQARSVSGDARQVVEGISVLDSAAPVDLAFVFNKPMREFRNDDWNLLSGESDPIPLTVTSTGGTFSNARWSTTRWGGDTLVMTFTPTATSGTFPVSIRLADAVAMALDGDPRTPAVWTRSGWSGWESTTADTLGSLTLAPAQAVGWTVN